VGAIAKPSPIDGKYQQKLELESNISMERRVGWIKKYEKQEVLSL